MNPTEFDHLFQVFCELPIIKTISFTTEEIAVFRSCMQIKCYKKKEKLIEVGEIEMDFRWVFSGLVRQYYIFEEREINTKFSVSGDTACSYVSYMSGEASEFIIETVEPSVMFAFDRQSMDKMMIGANARFIELGKRISATIGKHENTRAKELLNYGALDRLQHFMQEKSDLFLRLPQVYIASYLNVQPETFSALKKKLM